MLLVRRRTRGRSADRRVRGSDEFHQTFVRGARLADRRRIDAVGALSASPPGVTLRRMEHGEVTDRQLEALLDRLDTSRGMHERARRREELTVIAHELRNLNESLQAIAYAALGTQGPQVRRRRSG